MEKDSSLSTEQFFKYLKVGTVFPQAFGFDPFSSSSCASVPEAIQYSFSEHTDGFEFQPFPLLSEWL